MSNNSFTPDQAAGRNLNIANQLFREKRIAMVSQTRLDDDHVSILGKNTDSFNFINHPSIIIEAESGKVVSYSCDCRGNRSAKPCVHCMALSMLVEQNYQVEKPLVLAEEEETVATSDSEDVGKEADSETEISKEPEPIQEDVNDLAEEREKGSMQIVFGTTEEDEKLVWYPNDTEQVFNVNLGIIGTMGTGKTQFTKSLITQLIRQREFNYDGSPLNILIFDYKGDYNKTKPEFVNAVNAKVKRPYLLPFNPLCLHKREQEMPVLPAHTANAFVDTIDKICALGTKQRNTLLEYVLRAYQEYGIDKYNEATWKRMAPTFEQVYELFEKEYDVKDSLYAIMNKLHNFRIFEDNPLRAKPFSEVLKGVVVIDISGYEKDLQDLIVAITLDQFYAQMYAMGSSKTDGRYRQLTNLILVDEADGIMSKKYDTLKNILKEGREFGAGVILSTQFLSHFGTGADTYSSYVSTWVVHQVNDMSEKEVESIMGVQQKLKAEGNYAKIKALKKHQSLVKIMNQSPVTIQDLAFWQLMAGE